MPKDLNSLLHTKIPPRFLRSICVWATGATILIVFTDSTAIGWTIGCLGYHLGRHCFGFSPVGKNLWEALRTPDGWKFSKYSAHHEPSNTKWWCGNGVMFFDGFEEEGTPKCLGIFERIPLWWRYRRLSKNVIALKFSKKVPERLLELEQRLGDKPSFPKMKKYKLPKDFFKSMYK